MIFKLLHCVRRLRGIDEPANLDDRLVVRGFDKTNQIAGWEHGEEGVLLQNVTDGVPI
jgi:hypothetical protein